MNIFALDPDPAISASMHCDQHLHKMILESAQMLSTAARARGFNAISSWLYKSAYEKHPCTIWTGESNHNMLWVCSLATELNSIRVNEHSSMDIIHAVEDYIHDEFPFAHPRHVEKHIFCGPDGIRLRADISIHQKYQLYYTQKYRAWLDTRQPMSYKNRPLPDFLSQYKDSIPHG